jgi:hypothetical protein
MSDRFGTIFDSFRMIPTGTDWFGTKFGRERRFSCLFWERFLNI